jgi:hypothetical protein
MVEIPQKKTGDLDACFILIRLYCYYQGYPLDFHSYFISRALVRPERPSLYLDPLVGWEPQ